MRCPTCGKTIQNVESKFAFCPYCGAKLTQESNFGTNESGAGPNNGQAPLSIGSVADVVGVLIIAYVLSLIFAITLASMFPITRKLTAPFVCPSNYKEVVITTTSVGSSDQMACVLETGEVVKPSDGRVVVAMSIMLWPVTLAALFYAVYRLRKSLLSEDTG